MRCAARDPSLPCRGAPAAPSDLGGFSGAGRLAAVLHILTLTAALPGCLTPTPSQASRSAAAAAAPPAASAAPAWPCATGSGWRTCGPPWPPAPGSARTATRLTTRCAAPPALVQHPSESRAYCPRLGGTCLCPHCHEADPSVARHSRQQRPCPLTSRRGTGEECGGKALGLAAVFGEPALVAPLCVLSKAGPLSLHRLCYREQGTTDADAPPGAQTSPHCKARYVLQGSALCSVTGGAAERCENSAGGGLDLQLQHLHDQAGPQAHRHRHLRGAGQGLCVSWALRAGTCPRTAHALLGCHRSTR